MPLIHAEIDTPLTFTRFQALSQGPNGKAGCYPGVLVIQKGPAKGHFAVMDGARVVNYQPGNPEHAELQKYQIVIDDVTLDDVVRCGEQNGETKCKLDHGSTVKDIVGDYSGFQRSGDEVRAFLTLDSKLELYDHADTLVRKFAKKIGNSIDFDYSYEINGDVAVARCHVLNSVDIVDAPAATKSLFEQKPNPPKHMPLDANDLKTIGEIFDSKLTAVKTDLDTKLSAISKRFEEAEEESEEEKKKKKEKEDGEKGEMSTAKMAEVAEKAALAAVEKAFPKIQREQFARIGHEGESEMASLVKTYMAAGAPNQGIAIQRVSRDHPAKFNAWQKAGGTL